MWQSRYWEHRIRDEDDLARHIEYVHRNPVKHGLVPRAFDWEYSTFRSYVDCGAYAADWLGGGGIASRPTVRDARRTECNRVASDDPARTKARRTNSS